ncbi:hypothetical protein P7C70_g3049, partial [Phenoliferia sp. Uapishka_3]
MATNHWRRLGALPSDSSLHRLDLSLVQANPSPSGEVYSWCDFCEGFQRMFCFLLPLAQTLIDLSAPGGDILRWGSDRSGSFSAPTYSELLILSLRPGGAAAFGVMVGARSFLSRALVGDGITLHLYDSVWALGNGALPRRLSKYAAFPVLIYLLHTASSSAVVAIYTASNEQVSANFGLPYPTIFANPERCRSFSPFEAAKTACMLTTDLADNAESYQLNPTVLLDPEDFDGLAFAIGTTFLMNGSLAGVSTLVDGLSMSIGNGIVPSLRQTNQFRNTLQLYGDVSNSLSKMESYIITNASTNVYTTSAPTVQASSTCVPVGFGQSSPLQLTNFTQAEGGTSWFVTVMDSNCAANTPPGQLRIFNNTGVLAVFSCLTDDEHACVPDHTSLLVLFADELLLPRCFYFDLNSSYVLPPDFYLSADTTNVAGLANAIVFQELTSKSLVVFEFASGSKIFDYTLAAEIAGKFDFHYFTQALYAMAVSKMVTAETWYATMTQNLTYIGLGTNGYFSDGLPANLSLLPNTVVSDALGIGPTGISALLIFVVGLVVVLLLASLVLAVAFPPVTLNPLDPVSVLLVAQNSPPALAADGGCLGDVNQVRSKGDRIQYRAVNNQHLAFVFGPSDYDQPKLGRMYG